VRRFDLVSTGEGSTSFEGGAAITTQDTIYRGFGSRVSLRRPRGRRSWTAMHYLL
jgi:hypothetical protein